MHVHILSMIIIPCMQVLSESVGKQLQFYRQKDGSNDTEATEQFVMMMDQFFDAFNVRSLSEGKKTRKPMRDPYRSAKDWRFAVCVCA